MRKVLEERLALLKDELKRSGERLQALEQERQRLSVAVLRYEGAIACLSDLLAPPPPEGDTPPQEGDTTHVA